MKKARAPDLTEESILSVLEIIDSWKNRLTWDLLIDAVAKQLGHKYSRFTFAEHERIARAFSIRKDALKGKSKEGPSQPRDERVKAALEQVDRYRAKVVRLEAENQLLLEQFVTWATNAERFGVTIAKLNAPTPKPSRDQTKLIKNVFLKEEWKEKNP
jgi:hypothetical protein